MTMGDGITPLYPIRLYKKHSINIERIISF
jgi:hypothetical protein